MRLFFTYLSIIFFSFSCTVKSDKASVLSNTDMPVPLLPKKILNVGFLAINGVYNSELMAPFDILQHSIFHTDPGMRTFIVSPTAAPITTFEQIKIIPDYHFGNTPEIDVLIVSSAEHNMDTDLEDEALIAFKKTGHKADFIMSLCDGAFMLAQAGLLGGLEYTTSPTDITKFRERFPTTHLT
jgi:transcriptional regulator GlxA family with amidase domain